MPVYSLISGGRPKSTLRTLTPLRERVRARPTGSATLLTRSRSRSPRSSRANLHDSILMDSLAMELGLASSTCILPDRNGKADLFQALDDQMHKINAQIMAKPEIEVPQYTKRDFYGVDSAKDIIPSYTGTSIPGTPGYRRSPVSLSGEYHPRISYVDGTQSALSNRPFPELLQFNQGDIGEYNPMGVYSSCSVIKNRALAQSSYDPDFFPTSMISTSNPNPMRVLTAPKSDGSLKGPLRYNTEYDHGAARVDIGTFDRSATIHTIGSITQSATSGLRSLTASTLK